MKFTLKDYQEEAVSGVLDRLRRARKRWHEDKEISAFSLSPTTFDKGVRDGSLPRSVRYLGCVRWDLHELDPALDRLRGGAVSTDNANPWD